MAPTGRINGTQTFVKRRTPATVALFAIATLGVYGVVWWYLVNRELRDLGRARQRPELGAEPRNSALAVTLGALVVVPAIISAYRTCRRIKAGELLSQRGELLNGWVALAAALLPPLLLLYLQQHLNRIWDHEVGAEEFAYQASLAAARTQVASEQKAYDKAVAAAEKRVQQASNPPPLAAASPFVLYEDKIKTPGGIKTLTPAVQATADSAGALMQSKRVTLTRFALTGVFAFAGPLQKKQIADTRELYLLVEGPDWAFTQKCDPNNGHNVRAFAQKVNLAARNVAQARANRENVIRQARLELNCIRNDQSALNRAQQQEHALKASDPRALTAGSTSV